MLTTLADGYRRHRFAWLFGSLILTITASPALHAIVPRVNAVEVLLAINLVAVVSTVGREHGMGWMLWIAGAFLALRAGQTASGLPVLVPFTEGLWVIGCLLGMLATHRCLHPLQVPSTSCRASACTGSTYPSPRRSP